MRVLFVVNLFPPGYAGGTEVINYQTCQGLMQQKIACSILVVSNRWPEPLHEWYEYGGIPIHRICFHTRKRRAWQDVFDWRVYRAVGAKLRQEKPDLVHIHNVSGATLAPYVACRRHRVPVVNTLHDLWLLCPNNMLYRRDGSFCDPVQYPKGCRDCFRRYDFWGDVPFRRSIFAALTSNVKLFVSPSRSLRQLHVDAGFDAERFRIVRHGLSDDARLIASHPGVRQVVDSCRAYRTIVFAGGGIEIKGAQVLLEAIPAMLRHVEDLRLVVVGEGEERFLSQFRQYSPSVRLLGRVPYDEMHPLLGSADLVVVPSVCPESFSLVTLESLQAGSPVVGSDFGAIPELIEDGKTGYLFRVGDASALAEQVILHFGRPARERRRMRVECAQSARTSLTLEKHIQGILQVYREVLAN